MGWMKDASHGGRGGNDGRSGSYCGRGRGRGRGGRGRSTLATMTMPWPCKALKLGTCKDLEGHIFTIGSGNKSKDRDMLQTLKEKMATFSRTKFGDDAAQEWTSEKWISLKEPVYSLFILDRHSERVKATKDQITLKVTSLRSDKTVIDDEIKSSPTDCKLMTEKQEIEDQIPWCEIKLKDEVEMKLTEDKKMMHSNTWQTHCELTDSMKKAGARCTLCCSANAHKY